MQVKQMCCYSIIGWTSACGTRKIYNIQGGQVSNLQDKISSIAIDKTQENPFTYIVNVPQVWFNSQNASKTYFKCIKKFARCQFIPCFVTYIPPLNLPHCSFLNDWFWIKSNTLFKRVCSFPVISALNLVKQYMVPFWRP